MPSSFNFVVFNVSERILAGTSGANVKMRRIPAIAAAPAPASDAAATH
jgi:hypothetical protein